MARTGLVAAVASSSPSGGVGRDVEAVVGRLWESCGPANPRAGADRVAVDPPGCRWDADRVDRLVALVESGPLERTSGTRGCPGLAVLSLRSGRGTGPELDAVATPGHPRAPATPPVLAPSLGLER